MKYRKQVLRNFPSLQLMFFAFILKKKIFWEPAQASLLFFSGLQRLVLLTVRLKKNLYF